MAIMFSGTFFCQEDLLEFAKLGSYCEYDLFGIEVSHYQIRQDVDMPSDAQRIAFVRTLLDNGYGKKVVIAHDIHTKHRLVTWPSFFKFHFCFSSNFLVKVRVWLSSFTCVDMSFHIFKFRFFISYFSYLYIHLWCMIFGLFVGLVGLGWVFFFGGGEEVGVFPQSELHGSPMVRFYICDHFYLPLR